MISTYRYAGACVCHKCEHFSQGYSGGDNETEEEEEEEEEEAMQEEPTPNLALSDAAKVH